MKKYIVPTITVEKIELTNLMAASPDFTSGEGLPTLGTTKGESADSEQTGHAAEGYSKPFNIWE